MKKIVFLLFLVVFVFVALVPDTMSQTRHRRHGKRKHWLTQAAIVGGGAAAGGLIAGKKGAVIGTGTGVLVASSRKGARKRYGNSKLRRAAQVGGGGLVGGGIGSYAGRKGAVVGALAGAGVTYLFTRNGHRYYKDRNGATFYYQNGKRHYV